MANEVTIFQGNDQTIEVTLVDSDGAAFDLTSAVVSFAVKTHETDDTVLIEKTSAVATEIAILSPATGGVLEIYIVPEDTEELFGKKVYDVTVVSGLKTYTVVKSSFDIVLPVE